MPFQTWLLYLKFENDSVTCFGTRTVMNCFSFRPESGQYMPNTSKYPNHLSSQISTAWMHLENQRCIALPFVISLLSPSNWLCLDPSFFVILRTLSPHDPILTQRRALAPSGPMLLKPRNSFVRVEFCLRPCAKAWQETHDLRNAMKPKANIILQSREKSPHNSSRKLKVLGSKTRWNNQKSMAHHWYDALLICCLFCKISDWSPNQRVRDLRLNSALRGSAIAAQLCLLPLRGCAVVARLLATSLLHCAVARY